MLGISQEAGGGAFYLYTATRLPVPQMSTVGDLGASGLAVQQLCKLVAPNSIPPERVFSILNYTFDDDQDRALADYIELSLQLQFNERSRSEGAAGVSLSVH